jgi:hypothetical protein
VRASQAFWSVVALFTLVAVSPQRTRAESDALTQRLEALDDAERALLAPQLARGAVGLVEFSRADVLPSVLVASYVEAPADLAAQIIGSPGEYPKFMKILDHVEVLSKSGSQTAYKWSWQTGVLFLEGENRMTAFAPPAGKPELGHRISVKSERGQLGEGRLLWRILPVTPRRSLVMLSMRVDMRDANFVMRQLDAAAKSVNRSVNIALCYVMLLGAKREAERRSGTPAVLPTQVAFDPPRVDLEKLQGLLGRADLLLMELTDKGLGKLSIVGRTDVPRSRIEPIINEPEMFGKSLVPGSYTRVTKREGNQKTFEWGIGLPLIGTSGTMSMRNDQGTVAIEAVEGALKGGRWRFDTPVLRSGEAVVVGYSQFDITKASWLIEKITSFDPVLGHGLAAATQVMLLRALRKRAHDDTLATPNMSVPPPAPAPSPVQASIDGGVDAGGPPIDAGATAIDAAVPLAPVEAGSNPGAAAADAAAAPVDAGNPHTLKPERTAPKHAPKAPKPTH